MRGINDRTVEAIDIVYNCCVAVMLASPELRRSLDTLCRRGGQATAEYTFPPSTGLLAHCAQVELPMKVAGIQSVRWPFGRAVDKVVKFTDDLRRLPATGNRSQSNTLDIAHPTAHLPFFRQSPLNHQQLVRFPARLCALERAKAIVTCSRPPDVFLVLRKKISSNSVH